MSYAQFGYTYQTSPQLLMTGQSSCCDSNQNAMATDHAAPSPTVCSLPAGYDSRLLSTYPRLATGLTVNGLYGSTYADQAGYVAALGSHPTSFYSTLSSPYDLKDGRTWPTLPQAAAACYSYDPTALASYGSYGERYDAMDSAARRKNATRETTNTLKAWLYEHRKNPYPTKGEKIMLAIITKMTLTQVSTWFANARRRLKKENKMTWEPKNKTGDMADGEDKSDGVQSDEEPVAEKEPKPTVESERTTDIDDKPADSEGAKLTESFSSREDNGSMPRLVPMAGSNCQMRLENYSDSPPITKLPSETDKPKIWSLAQTAISDTGPSSRKMAFDVPPVNSDLTYTDRTPSVSPSSTSGYWTPSSLRSVDQASDVGAMQSSPLEDNSRLPSVPTVNPASVDYNSRFPFSAVKATSESLEDGDDGEDGNIRTHCHKYGMPSDVKNSPRSLFRLHSNYYFDSSLATGGNRNSTLGWYISNQRDKDLIKDSKPYIAPNQVPVTTGDTTAFKPVTRGEQPIV